jgi:PhzF family phenazine biosynthesis protein
MRSRPFFTVDVFTPKPYQGNPLAVVMDAGDLSDAQMQQFAHWVNLSETTFLTAPSAEGAAKGADYRVRIFTPSGELPFAGHPTLGSCHVWLEQQAQQEHGLANTEFIVQECNNGLIRIRREGARLAFAAPPLRRSNPSPALLAQVAAALGLNADQIIAAQMLDNGPVWLGLLLDSRQTVLNLMPDLAALKPLLPGVGVASVNIAHAQGQVIARSNREARAFGVSPPVPAVQAMPDLEVRFFAPDIGVGEDPVTGGFNGSLAQWLIAEGHAPAEYIAAQGTCIGRAGRVHIAQDREGQVWVGGESVTCVKGQVVL